MLLGRIKKMNSIKIDNKGVLMIAHRGASSIERENTNVTLDVLSKLAAYTGFTVPELLTDSFVKQNYVMVDNHVQK